MLFISEMTVNMALSSRSSFVLATNNQGKVLEIKHLFKAAGLNLLSPADLGLKVMPNETGCTFEENSRIKAQETFRVIREKGFDSYGVIADDSGFEVDALDGLPGVDSALYLGENTAYEARIAHIIEKTRLAQSRKARFVCVLTCILPNEEELSVRSEVLGEIARSAKGSGGFGYDPIFYLPELGKTMAEISSSEKDMISHRGKAVRLLLKKLKV